MRGLHPIKTLRVALWLAGLVLLTAGSTSADTVNGFVEFTASDVDSKNELPSGELFRTKTDALTRRIRLGLTRSLFPNVRLRAGGLFETTGSTTDSGLGEFDTDTTKFRPYFDVALGNSIHNAQFTYSRNEDKLDPEGRPSVTDVQESRSTVLGWFPEGLPSMRLRVLNTKNYDKDREFRDTTSDRYEFSTDYEPIEGLDLYYQGELAKRKNKLEGNEMETETHVGRVDYSDSWLDRRLALTSEYRIAYRDTEVTTTGTGEIATSIFAFAGLSSIDDTPEEDPLDRNPALIDGNITAGAGINLGLTPSGGNDDPRNMGLDFAAELELNTLYVWIDRELPLNIAATFSWDVYTSEDNDEWLFQQSVSPALFDTRFRRFEVRFANLVTRYVKVVTRPLDPSVPFATDYPSILVTELDALLRTPATDVATSNSSTSHVYSLDLRAKILEVPSLYYEMNYFLTDRRDSASEYTLSNGLSLGHRINEVYAVAARLSHETFDERNADGSAIVYSASLSADPLDTLRQRLVVSGRDESFDEFDRQTNSVFLFNTLQPYPGIDVTVGLGKSAVYSDERGRRDNTQFNVSTTMVPHRTVTVNTIYRDDEDESSRTGLKRENRSTEINLVYNPLVTLYLFSSYRVEDRTELDRRTINNYTLSWSPFPDGSLRLNFNYNETLRSEDNSTERIITPNLRWNINNRSYLDLAYRKIKRNADTRNLETDILSGNLRIGF